MHGSWQEKTGIPADLHSLARIRDTIPQKELNHQERRKNLNNAFKMDQNAVKYKKVLLVDDIYTTGSTIDACAVALKEAGVQQVYFISLSIGCRNLRFSKTRRRYTYGSYELQKLQEII